MSCLVLKYPTINFFVGWTPNSLSAAFLSTSQIYPFPAMVSKFGLLTKTLGSTIYSDSKFRNSTFKEHHKGF